MHSEQLFIEVIKKRFLVYKELGEKAIRQLSDEQIHFKNSENDNSIYIIVIHLRGNMLSRFTDFLTSDGEKSWRNRDREFQANEQTNKEQLFKLWTEGWDCLLNTLDALKDADLQREVHIRGERHLVIDALLRQVAHYAYHVGQIVYIAKILKKDNWQSLSIPKGNSDQFNQQMKKKYDTL